MLSCLNVLKLLNTGIMACRCVCESELLSPDSSLHNKWVMVTYIV